VRATARFHTGTLARGAPAQLLVDGVGHAVRRAGERWWAVVPVPPGPAELVLRTPEGDTLLESLPAAEPAPPPPLGRPAPPGLIAVCMATFEPDPALFEAQVASLRAQTDDRWVCVVSDDASAPAHVARIRAVLGDDERFRLHPSTERRGFNANFERALGHAPAEAAYVALCDQDDRWHPAKLARLRAAIETSGAGLAFCDSRLADPAGRVLRDTLWAGRAVNHSDLGAMLVANSITGAAALMRREIADLALPFPEPPGIRFHDHWIACVALAAGDVAYVAEPLYDYVQHAGAVFGDVATGARRPRVQRPASARAAYVYGYLARAVYAHALLGRTADRIAPAKRRALERFLHADTSLTGAARLAAGGARAYVTGSSTLGAELGLAAGLLWRRAAAAGLARDTSVPPPGAFEQRRLRRWRSRLT
jgi:glycosyltransferase involved in cell wall biosynthesis